MAATGPSSLERDGELTRRTVLRAGPGAAGGFGGVERSDLPAGPGEAGARAAAGARDRHLLVAGRQEGEPVRYRVAVRGSIEATDDAGPPVAGRPGGCPDGDCSGQPSPAETVVAGVATGAADAYRLSGEIAGFAAAVSAGRGDEVGVYLDGSRVAPADLGDHPAAAAPVEFRDCRTATVRGEFRRVRLYTGYLASDGGFATDVFELDGVTGRTDLDVGHVYSGPFRLDAVELHRGEGQDPARADNPYAGDWCLERPDATHRLVVAGGSARDPAGYSFTAGGTLRKTRDPGETPVERATIDADDVVSGRSVTGSVAGDADAYVFTGTVLEFDLLGQGRVYLDGRRVEAGALDRTLPNLLVVGGGPAAYEFEASGRVEATTHTGTAPVGRATADAEAVSGGRVRGVVDDRPDAYRFSGELAAFSLAGDGTVYLNGSRMAPADLGR